MRRKEAQKRAGVVPILLAGCVGYLLGNAHIAAFRSTDLTALSAAQFCRAAFSAGMERRHAGDRLAPAHSRDEGARAAIRGCRRHLDKCARGGIRDVQPAADHGASSRPGYDVASDIPDRVGGRHLAGIADERAFAGRAVGPAAGHAANHAACHVVVDAVANAGAEIQSRGSAARAGTEGRSGPASARQRPGGAGYMLNDTQIASIKERLHLTPDQERCGPRSKPRCATLPMRGRSKRADAALR